MQTFKYQCRKAKTTDSVETLARYIHLTDPYIYPKICENPVDEKWVKFIGKCMEERDNIFHINNLSVVLCDDSIIGIACVVPCGKKLCFSRGEELAKRFGDNAKIVVDGYFKPLILESSTFCGHNIVNVCIDEKYRGKGAGSSLMSYCIKEYGTQPIHLDVIASNENAIRLYKKTGFQITNEYYGFTGDNTDLQCYHMLRESTKAE
jgi:ribosomal protein S18 acetylase RimI-like enzyme